MTPRVVVTGIGLVTPCGVGEDATWEALVTARSGIGPIRSFDASGLATRFAGEVTDFEPSDFLEGKEARRMERFQQFAVAASDMAMADAGFSIAPGRAERGAVIVGSCVGGLGYAEEQYDRAVMKGPGAIHPLFLLQLLGNMAPARIAIRHGFEGPNWATNSACATSAHAVGEGMRLIQRAGADVVLAGGTEAAVCLMAVGGFNALRALSTRNDEPERASRPFDRDRDGFVLAEGAAVLLLERLEHALDRGAEIRAELAGYGSTADAHHLTAPAPGHAGGQRAMREALADAAVSPDEVDYVNAHATSTPVGDPAEATAIREVFGRDADRIPVSSTKSMTGHMLGAAGAAEAAFSIMVMERGTLPPTANLENPEEGIDLDCVPREARPASLSVVMTNSFGFGGTNASLVFRRYEDG